MFLGAIESDPMDKCLWLWYCSKPYLYVGLLRTHFQPFSLATSCSRGYNMNSRFPSCLHGQGCPRDRGRSLPRPYILLSSPTFCIGMKRMSGGMADILAIMKSIEKNVKHSEPERQEGPRALMTLWGSYSNWSVHLYLPVMWENAYLLWLNGFGRVSY